MEILISRHLVVMFRLIDVFDRANELSGVSTKCMDSKTENFLLICEK